MSVTFHNEPLRISILRDVLEGAKANNDRMVMDACYRILSAYRLGRDKTLKAEWAIVKAFAL